jgi:hypothetical protein
MVMRDEHIPDVVQRNTCKDELARDSVATINDVRDLVRHDYLCRCRVGLSRAGSAARAKEDQPGLAGLRFTSDRRPSRSRQRSDTSQK